MLVRMRALLPTRFAPPRAWRPEAGSVTSRQAPPSGAIGRRDGSAVLVNDALGHRESEAGALGVQTRGDKRFENIGQHVGRDAGAVVFHRDRDPGLRVAIQAPGMDRDFARGGMA